MPRGTPFAAWRAASSFANEGLCAAATEGVRRRLSHRCQREQQLVRPTPSKNMPASTSNGVNTSSGVDGSEASSCGPDVDVFAPGSAQYLPGLHMARRQERRTAGCRGEARTAIREEVAAAPTAAV